MSDTITKDEDEGGTEGYSLDKDGKKTDRAFWDDLLGDDVLPTDFDYAEQSKTKA